MSKNSHKKRPKSSDSGWAPLGLAGLAIVLLVYFVFKKKAFKTEPQENGKNKTAQVSEARPVEIIASKSEVETPQRLQSRVNRLRANEASESRLGIVKFPLNATDGFFSIPFVFSPRKIWCQGGDLDTMKHALNGIESSTFLVTLQPLRESEKGETYRTTLGNLFQGFTHVFKIREGKPGNYALTICSDQKGTNTCAGKSLTTHSKIADEVVAHDQGTPSKDYIFYFQHLIVNKTQLYAYRSDDASTRYQNEIRSYLQDEVKLSSDTLAEAWKMSSTLRSSPLGLDNGKIKLSLPYNDPECGKVKRPK